MSARPSCMKLPLLVGTLLSLGLVRPLVAESNERIFTSEAPIVNRNAMQAEQRARADAFRQATESAFQALIKEAGLEGQALSPGLAQLKASLASKGQRFVRSYRVLEKDESNGQLRLQIDADINTALLRREIERVRGASSPETAATQPAPAGSGILLLGGELTDETRKSVTAALGSAGVRVQVTPLHEESKLLASAAKQNGQSLWISATWANEGAIRGTPQVSGRCELRARLLSMANAGSAPLFDRTLAERGVAADDAAARQACVGRAAGIIARQVSELMRPAPVTSRFVAIDLDVVEPAALMSVVQAAKRLGTVSAVEVRRISLRQAEIRVFSRVSGGEIQTGLLRELADRVTLTEVKPPTGRLTLRARLRSTSETPTAAGAEPPAHTP